MPSKININGVEYDLKNLWDRSQVLKILKEAMKGCDDSVIVAEGDSYISVKK